LLDTLKEKATPADVLYGDEKSLEKKIEDLNIQNTIPKPVKQAENKPKWTSPVKSGAKIRSSYGWRIDPIEKKDKFHSGIDLAVPIGTPVQTIYPGTITRAGAASGYGTAVFVDHGVINGKRVVSEYGHLSKVNVKYGDKVSAGQIIAKSGNAGKSTGAHLHITIRENGKSVDPKKYINFE